jgi:hypothetical protein
MAFPFEHGLQTTLIAMRLADRLGVTADPCASDEAPLARYSAAAGAVTGAASSSRRAALSACRPR